MRLIADQTERLDRFLARMLPQHSRTKLAKAIESGNVLVDSKPQKPSCRLEPGMQILVTEPEDSPPQDLTPADIPLQVAFEDDSLLVVNKPRGLASHPASSLHEPSLVNALLARGGPLSAHGPSFRPGIVHRLDKDTTGLMLIAKTDAAHVSLARQIASKSAERRYLAIVAGALQQADLTIDAPLARDSVHRQRMAVDSKGKPARTHVHAIARVEAGSLLAVRLETGRTHQIRIHLRAIGHPVIGDRIYAPKEFQTAALQLHAGFLAFNHPETGERIELYVDPPADFLAPREYCAALPHAFPN